MFIKNFIIFTVLLISILLALYNAPENFLSKAKIEVLSYFKPCLKPIKYSIGNFDSRFNISEPYFLSALSEAEEIWEKSFGKELFSYSSGSDELKINLSYDTRQLVTSLLKKADSTSEENKDSYGSLKRELSILEIGLEADKKTYQSKLESYNQKQREYNSKIEYWNKIGGAPEKDFNDLEIEKSRLEAELKELNIFQREIETKVGNFNNLVLKVNKLAKTINIASDEYNKLSATRGETFQEGEYRSYGMKKEINIYEFDSRENLVRLLAHELGHALGIEHVADKKSIMYELNQGKSMTLSADDILALKSACKR